MINEVKELFDFVLGRNKRAGRYPLNKFNLLCKAAQNEIIEENVEVNGIEAVSYTADVIAPLKKRSQIAILGSTFLRPADFLYFIGLEHTYDNGGVNDTRDIDILRDNEYNSARNSVVEPPTLEFPKARYVQTGWEVLPTSIVTVNITYIQKPDDPKWAYTPSGTGEAYDEGNSTDFMLGENVFTDLVYRMLRMSGINLRQGEIVQIADSLAKEEIINLINKSS